jgi:hypothetical protein
MALSRRNILKFDMEIFDSQLSDRSRHPAILVPMVVYRTALPYLPAHGDKLIEIGLVDQIARVMLPVPGQVRCKTEFRDRYLGQQRTDQLNLIESRDRQRTQLADQFVDRESSGWC